MGRSKLWMTEKLSVGVEELPGKFFANYSLLPTWLGVPGNTTQAETLNCSSVQGCTRVRNISIEKLRFADKRKKFVARSFVAADSDNLKKTVQFYFPNRLKKANHSIYST